MQNRYPQPPFSPRPMQAPYPNPNSFPGFQGVPNQMNMNMTQPQPVAQQEMKPPIFQSPYEKFSKPPQPNQWNHYYSLEQQFPQYGQMQGPNGFMQYFQDKNGQIDIDKMLSTMGQVANTANQFSPLVKSLGSLFIK